MTRVSTFYQNQANLKNLQANSSALDTTTYQITTGNKYKNIGEAGGVANSILTLHDVSNRLTTYSGNIDSANTQLKATEKSLQDMADIVTQATALLTQARNENSAETRTSLAPKAQALAESFYATYKSQYNGVYLFSGNNGTQPPVAGDAAATAFPTEVPLSTAFYQGDSQQTSVLVGPNQTQGYGVTGNDAAFANLKASLEALWHGLKTNDLNDLDQANVGLQSAKSGVTTLLGKVGGQMNAMEQLSTRYEDQQTFLIEQSATLEKADTAEALTTYSQQSATLQASMMIITQVSQLTLMDYLR